MPPNHVYRTIDHLDHTSASRGNIDHFGNHCTIKYYYKFIYLYINTIYTDGKNNETIFKNAIEP